MSGKKFFLVCIIFLLLASFSHAQQLGDVNNSGTADIVDALLIAQYYVGFAGVLPYPAVADVNCNGNIDIIDALLIAQYYVDLIHVLPCGSVTNPPDETFTPTPASTPTATPIAMPTEGEFRIAPSSQMVYPEETFTTLIYINSGAKKIMSYGCKIEYSNTSISLDKSISGDGIEAGTDGFYSAANVNTPGLITIGGFRSGGVGPGTNLHFLTIHWRAVTQSTSIIKLTPTSLDDSDTLPIGSLISTTATVNVLAITPGEFRMAPSSKMVYPEETFTTLIYINSGAKKIMSYGCKIEYSNTSISLDKSISGDGIEAGTDGFYSAANVNTPGLITIGGFRSEGVGPGTNLHFLTIHWRAVTQSTSIIRLTPTSLDDSDTLPIGSLIATTATVNVLAGTPEPTVAPTAVPTVMPSSDPTAEPTPTPTPDPAGVTLRAMYSCGQIVPISNAIKPHVSLINTSTEDIELENITFRYFYTKDGEGDETANVLFSSMLAENVITTFHQDYLEVGFAPDSGTLHPSNNSWGEVHLDVHKFDLSEYNQTDDWSFDPTKTLYTNWDHIAVYYDGVLKWGTLPPPPVTALNCDIEIPASFSGTTNHWIPNTGNRLDSLAIKLIGYDSANEIVPLTDTLANIMFLPPVDQNWSLAEDPIDANNANIRRNRGTCMYYFSAHTPGNTDYQEIARFTRNENPADINTTFVNDWLNIGVNNGLRVDANGYLYYFDGVKQYTRFAVSVIPEANRTIRPGDDMKLRFALADNLNVFTTASDGDFLAVYDKKLLWRANLYLDERINHETGVAIFGAVDWNNANPWVGDAWDALGNGGQINLDTWTRFDDSTGGNGAVLNAYDNGEVYGSVAYSWGGTDSPADFNADMQDQKSCLLQNNPNWILTTSPDGLWSGYRFGTPNNDAAHTYAPLSAQLKPYTPNFRTYRYFLFNDDQSIYTRYSAGDDCTGFVQRAASYQNNHYTLTELKEQRLIWDGTWDWGVDKDLTSNAGPALGTTFTWPIANTNLIIPGDIFIIPGHAAIVMKIIYNADSRITNPAKVYFIEAAYADGQYMVVNTQSWQTAPYNGNGEIKRLITTLNN